MLLSSIKAAINKRLDKFLTARIPASSTKTLDSKSIFIFPTRFGFAYLFVMVLLFLLGTNYRNNVIILFAYLQASFFITAMMLSYYNMKGLVFICRSQPKSYAEQQGHVSVKLVSDRARHNIALAFADYKSVPVVHFDQEIRVNVPYQVNKRGVHPLGRIKAASRFGFGLFTTWTWIDFGLQATVYPKIKQLPQHYVMKDFNRSEQQQGEHIHSKPGIDEFAELKAYVQGEPLSRVSWKHLARGQGKLTKHYQDAISDDNWLSLEAIAGRNLEEKLSYLAYLVNQNHLQNIRFGLDLGKHKIEPEQGSAHSERCLTALSNY